MKRTVPRTALLIVVAALFGEAGAGSRQQKPSPPNVLLILAADPGEQSDVAAANPKVVARMEEHLKSARTESVRWLVK